MTRELSDLPTILADCEPLSRKDRQRLLGAIEWQFTLGCAYDLYDIGDKEKAKVRTALQSLKKPSRYAVLFTPSAEKDIASLGDWRKAELDKVFQRISQDPLSGAPQPLDGRPGFVHKDTLFPTTTDATQIRVVFHLDKDAHRIIVFAVALAAANPLLKVWRYFDQWKAKRLIESKELYFRRLDLLEDEYEGTIPWAWEMDEATAFRKAGLDETRDFVRMRQQERRAIYVCCWRCGEVESYWMWRNYCRDSGGFAIRTTFRKLWHLSCPPELQCGPVSYIDYGAYEVPRDGAWRQAFCKPVWFADEHEVRLAIVRSDALRGTLEDQESKLALLNEGEPLACDLEELAEELVFNPFASSRQEESLRSLLSARAPGLLRKRRHSVINTHPKKLLASTVVSAS
jgi:hypothetical protein